MNEENIKALKSSHLLLLATSLVALIVGTSPNSTLQILSAIETLERVDELSREPIMLPSSLPSRQARDYLQSINGMLAERNLKRAGSTDSVIDLPMFHEYTPRGMYQLFGGIALPVDCDVPSPFSSMQSVRAYLQRPIDVSVLIPIMSEDEKATFNLFLGEGVPRGSAISSVSFELEHSEDPSTGRWEPSGKTSRFTLSTNQGVFRSAISATVVSDRVVVNPGKRLQEAGHWDLLFSRTIPLPALQPFWPIVARETPADAMSKLQEIRHTQDEVVGLPGFDFPMAIAGFVVPIALLVASTFFLTHVSGLSRLIQLPNSIDFLSTQSWFALYPGNLPAVLIVCSVFVLPSMSISLFALSFWPQSDLLVRLCVSAGAVGTTMCSVAANRELWRIRGTLRAMDQSP